MMDQNNTFSEEDKQRILSFYNNLINQHGSHSYKSLGWSNEFSRNIRYQVLCGVGKIDSHSILDIGCGFGDFYDFLNKHSKAFTYKGIDINPRMIEVAKQRYPKIDLQIMDFGHYNGEKYDYSFASGAFSFKIPNYKQFYFGFIKKMFEFSKLATAFNMLNSTHHVDDHLFATYSVPEVYQFCCQLTEKIIIRQDYLSHDFTFYLYH